ncbi:MAG: hypothetical protein NDJ92_01220, partial [Thermoanaerobaculia bacterium]|nr:hypothetical protein [Thermoanaerobaculia bacterium]
MVFGLLLVIPPSPYFTAVVQQASLGTLAAIGLVLALLFRRDGFGREALQATAVLSLFAIALLYKWQFAHYDGSVVGGLLPWSDASAYYENAARLVHGLSLNIWGARRPLFSGFLSVMLRLTGGSLTGALALLCLLNGVAVLMVARTLSRWAGGLGATAYVLFAFKFYVRFAGTTLTEQLGFALGNLALFFLLAGVLGRRVGLALVGLGLLTLGLNARAGAFLVLPVLIIWLSYEFRMRHPFVRTVALATFVVCSGFGINLLLVKVMSAGRGVAFSNYSYTLYGLASGNKGWDLFVREHPNVAENEVMGLAIEKIVANPALLARGMAGAFLDYFRTARGAFTFLRAGSAQSTLNAMLWLLALFGAAYAAFERLRDIAGLSTASMVGVLASLPLLPPIDADGMRVFATTIPFCALWVITGGRALGRLTIGRLFRPSRRGTSESSGVALEGLAFGIAAFTCVAAVLLPVVFLAAQGMVPGGPHSLAGSRCGVGEQTLEGSFLEDATFGLIPDHAAQESLIPYVRVSDFRRSVTDSQYPFLDEELRELDAGAHVSIGFVWDGRRQDGSDVWLISRFPVTEGEFALCGRRSANEQLRGYNFYYASGSRSLDSPLTFSQKNARLTAAMRVIFGIGLVAATLLLAAEFTGRPGGSPAEYLCSLVTVILLAQSLVVYSYIHGSLYSRLAEQRIVLKPGDFVPE